MTDSRDVLIGAVEEVLLAHCPKRRPIILNAWSCNCGASAPAEAFGTTDTFTRHQAERVIDRLGIEQQRYRHCAYHQGGDHCLPIPVAGSYASTDSPTVLTNPPLFRVRAAEVTDD